jgi:hypothetical protein
MRMIDPNPGLGTRRRRVPGYLTARLWLDYVVNSLSIASRQKNGETATGRGDTEKVNGRFGLPAALVIVAQCGRNYGCRAPPPCEALKTAQNGP